MTTPLMWLLENNGVLNYLEAATYSRRQSTVPAEISVVILEAISSYRRHSLDTQHAEVKYRGNWPNILACRAQHRNVLAKRLVAVYGMS